MGSDADSAVADEVYQLLVVGKVHQGISGDTNLHV